MNSNMEMRLLEVLSSKDVVNCLTHRQLLSARHCKIYNHSENTYFSFVEMFLVFLVEFDTIFEFFKHLILRLAPHCLGTTI